MKRCYETPTVELVSFDSEEVLAASGEYIIDSNESANNSVKEFGSMGIDLW